MTSPDRELDAKFAETVMGWKDVHRVQVGKGSGEYFGKKPDKLGRFRKARVPEFCNDPGIAADIEARMKQLGLWKRYEKELSKATRAKGLPSDWATPEQACRAALMVVKRPRLSAVK
jgi:hypothetical protein